MAINRKPKIPTNKSTKTLNVTLKKGENQERKFAEIKLSPTILNTITAQTFIKPLAGEIGLEEAVMVMNEKAEKVNNGDLSDLEATLTAQVVSLNSIFNAMANHAADNMGQYLNAAESYMRLALKAQAQCARTIEILAAIKTPPVVFAKQANIAHGHQQINNDPSYTHAGKSINSSNELLSEANHAPLDTGGTIETGRVNQELATVETFDRGKNASRQS
ncbi:hypothetical protein [Nitrosomonas communis]|uniref:Uncharacterized protein n=1 Tax=Nitrosomonas communis TaxID=44574 RepID=A0A1I4UQ54_9PROT|nr:hypothetical protein [Nitrosomonas communis]SFM91096.1 hypothetical protein SAMN05421863_106816 [Nitrosomonas communis]